MITWEQLFDDNRIRRRYDENPHHKANYDNCLKALLEDPKHHGLEDFVRGALKAFSAIEGEYRVFISYRHEEHAASASKLHRVLEGLGAGKINSFLDSASIPYGSEWRERIRSDLEKCNALIVLVPPPTNPGQWAMYEPGVFEGLIAPGDKLFVIHHPTMELPSPLSKYQSTPATLGHLREMLQQILMKPGAAPGLPPINTRCSDLIDEKSADIERSFVQSELDQISTIPFVNLQLEEPKQDIAEKDIFEARVYQSQGLREIFRYNLETAERFQDVLTVSGQLANHTAWLSEVVAAVNISRRGGFPEQVFDSFKGDDETSWIRPVLRKIHVDRNKMVQSIELIFGQVLGGRYGDPPEFEVLRTALRLATRIRWEIIKVYFPLKTPDEVEKVERIWSRLEREAEKHGLMNKHLLAQQFPDPERQRVLEMFDSYEGLRDPKEHNGRLDRAFQARDVHALNGILGDVHTLNREFMLIGAKRYLALIDEKW